MIPREENKGRKGGSTFQKWLPVLALVILGGFFISIFLSGKGYSNAAIVAHYFIPPFIKTVPANIDDVYKTASTCLLYTSPSPRDATLSRMPSSA